jgi:hypothetical protein
MNASNFRMLAILSLCVALGSIGLWAQSPIQATIPFDFTMGAKTFHAGDYMIRQQSSQVLGLQRLDGGGGAFSLVQQGKRSGDPDKAYLIFHRIGDRYFLSQVSDSHRSWDLPRSVTEKEMMAKAKTPAPKPLTILAYSAK